MSLSASDLIVYGSTVMATGDAVANQGGAINTDIKIVFTDIAATDGLVARSSAAGDGDGAGALEVTVTGRNAGGSIVTDVFDINGTGRVVGDSATQFERILAAGVTTGSHTGTLTIERDDSPIYTDIGTMESGVNNIRRPFYNVSADVAGGSTRYFYEKIFLKNTHAVNSLLSAQIKESGEVDLGGSDVVYFQLEDAVDDTGVSSNRVTAPPTGELAGDGLIDDDDDKNVPGTDLAAGSAIGIWMELNLTAGASAQNGQWVMQATGSTT
jgi:hypothetical protein